MSTKHSWLYFLIVLLSCNSTQNNQVQNQIATNSSSLDNQPQKVSYDLKNHIQDTSFINNGATFIIWRDTLGESDYETYNPINCIVERIQNNVKDTILQFIAKPEFEYYINDEDGDGNIDIIVANDPQKWNHYYLFNVVENKFVDVGEQLNQWKTLEKGICFRYLEDLKGPYFNSVLFTVKNGVIKNLGYIGVEPAADNETPEEGYFLTLPKAVLCKIKNGNFNQVESTEKINEDVLKQHFNDEKEDHHAFFEKIWRENYKKFL